MQYLQYLLFSKHKTGHGIHSPFVYELIRNAFNYKPFPKTFDKIHAIRWKLNNDKSIIPRNDFGTGAKNSSVAVNKFYKKSSVNHKYGKLLYSLSHYFNPETILELGTAFGVSTLYLSHGNPESKIVTIEGCPETAKIAQQNFDLLKQSQITLVNGKIDEILPLTFFDLGKLDMVYFDGNHAYKPVMDYFEKCLSYAHENSVFIFDDIHWSSEMMKAWEEIKINPKVTISIDIYRLGLIFFKKDVVKQHFEIRY